MKRSVHKVGQLINKIKKKPFAIHLVEDNQFYLEGIRAQMKNTFGPNIQLKSYDNSSSFLSSLRRKPEIAVVDYNLDDRSDVDGINLIKEVRRNSPDTQIIVLTGENKIDTAVKCLNVGVSDYIVKEDKAIDKVTHEINDTMRNMLQTLEDRDYVKAVNRVFVVVLVVSTATMIAKMLFPRLFSL